MTSDACRMGRHLAKQYVDDLTVEEKQRYYKVLDAFKDLQINVCINVHNYK